MRGHSTALPDKQEDNPYIYIYIYLSIGGTEPPHNRAETSPQETSLMPAAPRRKAKAALL